MMPQLMTDWLNMAKELCPQKIALEDRTSRYSYEQWYKYSQKWAYVLQENGLQKGDRVAFCIENSTQLAIAIFAVIYAGGVFVVMNAQAKPATLFSILNDSGARFLMANSACVNACGFTPENLPQLQAVFEWDTLGETADENAQAPNVNALPQENPSTINAQPLDQDLAALIYTSGSSGEPKGVMITHKNIVFTTDSLCSYLKINKKDRILCFLPMAFDYGLYQIFMAVQCCAYVYISEEYSYPSVLIDTLQKKAISVFPAVPTVFSVLVRLHHKTPLVLPEITCVTSTAADLPAEFIGTLQVIFPNAAIFKMYGLTECKRVSYLPPEDISRFPHSVGRPIPGTQVCILDEHLQPVAPFEVGTLYVRGSHVMQGYWNKPEHSARMLVNVPGRSGPWLCAQDLFYCNSQGYLFFCGRNDEVIKTKGEKVSPVEIENCLYALPEILEVAVIGVPDAHDGQSLKAFIVPTPGHDINLSAIHAHCLNALESHKIPKHFEISAALPKTLSQKINKLALLQVQ